MTYLPIVIRELQVASRKGSNYYLRTLAAAAVTGASVIVALDSPLDTGGGGRLFAYIHLVLFCSIWVLVPFMTADCLSRERREGTLGLLFLTPLRAGDIVIAKGLTHALRATTVWLAAVPVVSICFLLGGVGWLEVGLSNLVNFSALCLALAAGLLASSLCRQWTRASALAACFAVLLCALSAVVVCMAVVASQGQWGHHSAALLEWVYAGLYICTDGEGCWARPGRINHGWWSVALVLGSLFCMRSVGGYATWRIRRVWRDEPPSTRRVWLERKLFQPVFFKSLFHRWMRYCLAKNPIGWLEQRRWSSRLVMWCWLGVATCFCAAAFAESQILNLGVSTSWYQAAILSLLGSLAVSAAGSFRRERETGVLELLLVSPLSTSAIISGRMRGLWIQFLPALGLLLGTWSYLQILLAPFRRTWPYNYALGYYAETSTFDLFYFAIAFLTVPAIGLYYSLRCRNFMVSFVASVSVGLIAPWLISLVWIWWAPAVSNSSTSTSEAMGSGYAVLLRIIFQGALGALCYNLLLKRLEQRSFPLERTGSA
jgi:ABC-type transport system involved in multi-copper enzyme maturation permease subunit